MIKKFTQLNEGAVPGKPVVIPTDASTLTDVEKKGSPRGKSDKGKVEWRHKRKIMRQWY